MLRAVLLLALMGGPGVAASAQGPLATDPTEEEAPVEIVLTGQGVVDTDPGEVFSVGFVVRNRTDSLMSFVPVWTVPSGWQVLTPPTPFEVAPRGQALRLVSVRVAHDQPPGSYPIRYAVRARGGGPRGAFESRELLVRVAATRALRLELSEVPRYVSAEEPHTVRFLMHNVGNEVATVRLSVTSRPFDARLLEEVVTVTANSGRTVDVIVQPGRALETRERSYVDLTAHLDADSTVVVQSQAQVDVIPGKGRLNALRPRWGLDARLSALGRLESIGTQVEVQGRLPLSGDSLHVAEFDVRPPASAASNYTQAPRYIARYQGPHARAQLGTGVYGLSPLTNPGRHGVGGSLSLGTDRIEGYGYHRTTTNRAFPDGETGGAARYNTEGWGQYSLSALAGQGFTDGEAVALRAEVPFSEALEADVEAGASHREAWQPMLRIGVSGRSGLASYSARVERRGPDFPGAVWGVDARALSASARVLSRAYAMGAWADERLTSVSGEVRQRQIGTAGLSSYLDVRGVRVQGGLELRYDRSVQPLLGGPLDRSGTLVRLIAGASFNELHVSTRTSFGRVRDADSGLGHPFTHIELETGWREGPHRIHTHVEYTKGPTVESPQVTTKWAVRLGGEEHIGERFDVRIDLGGGALTTDLRTSYGSIWAALGYQLPRGRRLVGEVQGFLQHYSNAVLSTSYRLSLELPLGGPNPLALRGNLVEGYIVDERTGEGIANVLVTLGNESALTDEDGRFVVPRPAEGTHYLFLDRVSLGLHRVPAVPIPYPVEIPAVGPLPVIQIPVSMRTVLSGRVRRYEVQGGAGTVRADTVDVGPGGRVVVEVQQRTLRFRQQADAQGRYTFNDLPPGRWAVRVVRTSVPEGYIAERTDAIVDLVDEARQDLRLLPPERRIQMLRGGALHSQDPPEGPEPLGSGRPGEGGDRRRETAAEPKPDEEGGELRRQVLRVGGRRP